MTPPTIGLAERGDLSALLALYRHLHARDPVLSADALVGHWDAILANLLLRYVVARARGEPVSTCALTLVPNLTRAARPYGLIENVVTHPDWRRQGIGTSVLHYALDLAWEANCYKVMLLTGRADEPTLRFYERAGFVRGEKTGFVARPGQRQRSS
ncbi:MAG: GNAT family N-acetyltransferase [Armatimonadetes bacterium]|nr:GNAT family N-acetyltransferase [Armatimonadota bacterium]